MIATSAAQPALRLNRRLRRLDFGLLITLALCAFSLWPLLYRPGLPNGTDVLYHVYRAAEMDRSWSHGVLLPRWAETFYLGYGSPLFHYYAGLCYYFTSLLSRLFALDAVNSLRLLIALSMLGSGAATYAFVRAYAGKLGGVIAALVYVYSPYILFTEPYARGAYPEMAALALLPFIFWSYSRVQRTGGGLAVVAAAISSGALIITHNLMALVLTGLLLGWLVWSLLAHWRVNGRAGSRPYLLALLAAAFGVGLAAYFWLPVMREGAAVRLGNLTAVAQLDYRNFFVPLDDLLASLPRVDAGAINGLVHQLNLGVPQWVLALTGLLAVIFRRSFPLPTLPTLPTQHSALSAQYFTFAALVCIFLMLPAAASVWSATAPLAFLQFPWRFLGPAAFCLAVLAGMNALWLERLPGRLGAILVAALIPAIIVPAMPALYVDEWEHETVDTSVAAYHTAELAGKQRATTFSNEYLPQAVAVEPDATPRLLADLADGYPVNRAHLESLPQGVTIEVLDNGPQHAAWRVKAQAPFTLEVLTFDFPGWTAEVDGQPAPITPSDPHGLITFPVPAGEHVVRLYLGSTPARDQGVLITLLSAAGMASVVAWLQTRRGRMGSGAVGARQAGTKHVLPLLLGGLLTLIVMVAYMREGGAWVESPPGEARLALHPVGYHLGNHIRLIGYDLNGDQFRPGDRLKLTVYWYASAPIPYGYASFVHVSTGGPPAAQADKLNPAGRPTREWTGDGFIRDDYVIDLPADLPPGNYQLLIGLYTCDTRPAGECGNGDRLPVTDATGAPVGDAVPLGTIMVQ